MPAVTFDTLKFANRLKNAGISSLHAEAEADALSEVFETNLSELATKEDLRHEMKELETGLRHEMKELKTGLHHEMKELETGLRHEISDLRKDIDARFASMDGRFASMDGRFASMDGRFAGVDAKLERLELRMTIKLGSIVVVALGAFTVIFKFL